METTVVYWGYMGIMEKKMECSFRFGGLGAYEHNSEISIMGNQLEKKTEVT